MFKFNWWRIGLVSVLAVGLLVVIGLTQAEVPNPDTVIEATIGEASTLDPAFAYDTASAEVIFNVYETLIFPKGSSVTEFEPLLATEVPSQDNGLIIIAADGKTYVTFPIREGVTFQNGDPLTPEDVAYSFERDFIQDRSGGPVWILLEPILGVDTFDEFVENVAKDLGVKDQFDEDLKNFDPTNPDTYTDTMKQVDVEAFNRMAHHFDVAAHSVTIQLEKPAGYFLATLIGNWGSILDKDWVASVGGWDGSADTWRFYHNPKKEKDVLFDKMNGTGPFKLDRWEKGTQMVLVRNDNYWNKDKMPKVEHAVIKKVDEWGTRFLMLQKGDADIVYVPRANISQVQPLVEAGKVNLYEKLPENINAAGFFNYNINSTSKYIGSGKLDGQGVPPDFFSDINVRKAFAYAFDYDTEIAQALAGEAIQPTGPIPAGNPFYQPDIPTYSLDLDKATEYFKKAWDGKLWENGFSLTLLYNTGNLARETAAEIWKQNIESINDKFHITVQAEDWPQYLDDLVAGNLTMFIIGWLEDYHDAHNWIQPYMASTGAFSGFQGKNLADYAKENWDPLIEKAATSVDPAERMEIYHQLEMDYYNQAPSVVLYQPLGRHYERNWVQGWYYNPIYPGVYFNSPLSKAAATQSVEVMDDTDGECVPSPSSPQEGWQLVELSTESTPGMISVDKTGNNNGKVCVITYQAK